jgi:acyl-CoA thioester hydrolase
MESISSHLPYAIEITVAPADIDELGHVNNVVYLRWVQDAAVAHWMAAANEDEKRSLLWVVVRHEIDYKRPALAGDTIIARTWVGTAARRVFERHTELRRKSDGKLLAKARTLWAPISAETRRLVDVGVETLTRFSIPADGKESSHVE